MERFHKEKFEEELAKSQKESTDTSQRTMDDFTSIGTPHVLKRWHKNSCNQIALDNEVLKFFIDSLIPFYNVERKSFRNMIWKSEPRWNPLGRSGLHSKMNSEFDAIVNETKNKLTKNKGFISDQVDISFIAIVSTIVTENFERSSFLTGFLQLFEGSHTGRYIADTYLNHLRQLGIEPNDIVRFVLFVFERIACFYILLAFCIRTTTDNGANILKAYRLILFENSKRHVCEEIIDPEDPDDQDIANDLHSSEVELENVDDINVNDARNSISCFCHSLHLCIGDGLKELKEDLTQGSVGLAVKKCHKISKLNHKSTVFADALNARIPAPIKTCWNYEIRTLESVIRLDKQVLKLALQKVKRTDLMLTPSDIAKLEKLVRFLDPIAKITTEAQADDATIAMVCFVWFKFSFSH